MTGRTDEQEDLIGVQRPKHPVGDYVHHPFSPLEHKRGNPNQAQLIQNNGQAQPGAEVFHDAPETPGEHGYTEEQHRMPGTWLADELKERSFHRPHLNTNKTLPELPREALDQEVRDHEPRWQENAKMTGNDPKNEGAVSASGGLREKAKGYQSQVAGDEVHGGQGTVHAQIVRSSADWSSGILTEQSIQNAYCQIIRDAKHYVYIENQVSRAPFLFHIKYLLLD